MPHSASVSFRVEQARRRVWVRGSLEVKTEHSKTDIARQQYRAVAQHRIAANKRRALGQLATKGAATQVHDAASGQGFL